MRKWHVVPVVGKGEQPLQIIGCKELIRAIESVLEKDLRGIFTVAHPSPLAYRQFYRMVASRLHIHTVLLPIPYYLMLWSLTVLEKLHISVGIGADSLRGLRKLSRADTVEDLRMLNLSLGSIDDYIGSLGIGSM